jgi:sulfur carrier protein
MKVNVNNQSTETSASTLAQLLEGLQLPANGIAVGVNNRMVPRTEWDSYALSEGLNIVVIKAACGG